MCDPEGSTSLSCDIGGKCTCKDGYDYDNGYGMKCELLPTSSTVFNPTTSDYDDYGGGYYYGY